LKGDVLVPGSVETLGLILTFRIP